MALWESVDHLLIYRGKVRELWRFLFSFYLVKDMLMGWDGSFVVGKREERLGEQLLFTFSIILKEHNRKTFEGVQRTN